MCEENAFHILSLDGGGARGIYSAQILASIEQEFGIPIKECFNLIAGTSTGAIVAGAAATGIPMTRIVDLFKVEAPRIFKKRRFSLHKLQMWSKYSRCPLERVIKAVVPDIILGEISTPLLITSSDISTGSVRVFKSMYLKELEAPYVRDADVALGDAILASCAAPIYFDPMQLDDFLLADGGLWANNPSIIALTEAVSKFERPVEQICILSIGTGHSVNLYSKNKRWGLLTGWRREKLVSYVLGLQSEASANMAKLFLSDRYLRLDPEIQAWDLDDIEHIDNLKAMAVRDFAHHSKDITKHLIAPQLRNQCTPQRIDFGPNAGQYII